MCLLRLSVPACGLLLAAVAVAAPPAQEHHDHALHATTPAVAPPAARWATDQPLREGMQRVRMALEGLPAAGAPPAEQARVHAAEVKDAVHYLFTHCRLAPEPDAALHAILVPLLAAARRLERDPSDVAAIGAMREAVRPYAAAFDDPRWPGATSGDDGHDGHAH